MNRLIRQGDSGPGVRDVQRRLARATEVPLEASGLFDDATREAVRLFQQARGLAADGTVGPETWRALVEAGYALGDRLLWHSRRLMRGDDVRDLQRRLNQLGFDAGPEDGIFGHLARAAVSEFQRNVGLKVDGTAGPQTIEALRRLQRDHQSAGLAARAREREWLRRLAGRGLTGARVLIDPAHGPDDPGHRGPSGATEAALTWEIATRTAARLSALGAYVVLSRGPASGAAPSHRARLANEQGADLVLSIALNGLHTPTASGAATYYFGTEAFVSEAGYQLAQHVQHAVVDAGWGPDCRTHPMTWAILRETRMPAVVIEPGFLTSPDAERRLTDPAAQDALAGALALAIGAFLEDSADLGDGAGGSPTASRAGRLRAGARSGRRSADRTP